MNKVTVTAGIVEVFPYLRVRDANAAIAFYEQAFGAEEVFRLTEPSERIGHAELKLGPISLMLSDEYPEKGIMSPTSLEGTGVAIHLHVDDVDSLTQRAVGAGATVLMEPANQFYGERTARVRDPFGHEWLLGQKIEEVPPIEMQERMDKLFQ